MVMSACIDRQLPATFLTVTRVSASRRDPHVGGQQTGPQSADRPDVRSIHLCVQVAARPL